MTTLPHRESLWADEPVMRDGAMLDRAHEALNTVSWAQSNFIIAIRSPKPDAWLAEAEQSAAKFLEHIRFMRSALNASMEKAA